MSEAEAQLSKKEIAVFKKQISSIEDEIKEIYDQYFDLESFDWLQLQCIREILQKAREKWPTTFAYFVSQKY